MRFSTQNYKYINTAILICIILIWIWLIDIVRPYIIIASLQDIYLSSDCCYSIHISCQSVNSTSQSSRQPACQLASWIVGVWVYNDINNERNLIFVVVTIYCDFKWHWGATVGVLKRMNESMSLWMNEWMCCLFVPI